MRGHTLVWYGAMPSWTKRSAAPPRPSVNSRTHIERVVSRYRGKIKTWHAVNEPIDDAKGAVAGLRPSIWLQRLGVKNIDTAFRLAHDADPSAELLINEYDVECVGESFTARRQALLTLPRDLLTRGVPLNGVGLQGHIRGKYQIDDDAWTVGSRDRARRHRHRGPTIFSIPFSPLPDRWRSQPGASRIATRGCPCGSNAPTAL